MKMKETQSLKRYNDSEIQSRLEGIFRDYPLKANAILSEIVNRGFVFPKLRYDKEVLFVGINPSFRGKKEQPTPPDYNLFAEYADKKNDRHFGHFFKLAHNSEIDDKWSYLDLFYFREGHQEKIETFIQDKEGKSFICAQLQLTFDIMNSLAPKVIVVCNNRIHDFFGRHMKDKNGEKTNVWMGFKFEKSATPGIETIKEIESDFIKIDDSSLQLRGSSVIFSSSLSTKFMGKEDRRVKAENLKQEIQRALAKY